MSVPSEVRAASQAYRKAFRLDQPVSVLPDGDGVPTGISHIGSGNSCSVVISQLTCLSILHSRTDLLLPIAHKAATRAGIGSHPTRSNASALCRSASGGTADSRRWTRIRACRTWGFPCGFWGYAGLNPARAQGCPEYGIQLRWEKRLGPPEADKVLADSPIRRGGLRTT